MGARESYAMPEISGEPHPRDNPPLPSSLEVVGLERPGGFAVTPQGLPILGQPRSSAELRAPVPQDAEERRHALVEVVDRLMPTRLFGEEDRPAPEEGFAILAVGRKQRQYFGSHGTLPSKPAQRRSHSACSVPIGGRWTVASFRQPSSPCQASQSTQTAKSCSAQPTPASRRNSSQRTSSTPSSRYER